MINITIAEWLDEGIVVSICNLFIEDAQGTIANLKTDNNYLKQGFAKKVMATAEKVAKGLQLKELILRVSKDSFMQDWYIRLGYKVFAEDEGDNSYIWLKKKI